MKRILLVVALAANIPASAFAWAGPVSSLTISFPDGTPREARNKVTDYLTKDLPFIKGRFFNTYVTQEFSGSTDKLNHLIQILHTNRFDLTVAFADLKDDAVTFSFFQKDTGPGIATIIINTTRKDFKWSELKIEIPPAYTNVEPVIAPKKPALNKP